VKKILVGVMARYIVNFNCVPSTFLDDVLLPDYYELLYNELRDREPNARELRLLVSGLPASMFVGCN
jgi:hypothetical protein